MELIAAFAVAFATTFTVVFAARLAGSWLVRRAYKKKEENQNG